ncbi:MAG TPA: MFS transporter [Thermomicrobiales bacterium]|nr:MFS transporter [Thermomicrobiales bacterium]
MPADSGSIRTVLRNQGFLRLWILQGTTQTAQNMINFALLILVREIIETQNISEANTAISLLVLAFSAPAVVFSPIAGVVVERADKRTIMIVANGLRALAVLAFLALDPAWPAVLTLAALYTITFFLGAVGQFFGPAQLAAIPVIVRPRDLISANALFNLTFTGSQVLGFALFGPLAIKLLGTEQTLVGILFLYIATTALATMIPSTPSSYRPKPDDDQHPFKQFAREAREGLSFVAERPLLIKSIIYLTLATTTYLMIAALGPEFIADVLGLPSEDIAYVVAPAGLGVVVGALLVNRVTAVIQPVRLVDLGLIGAGTSLALFALTEPVGSAIGLSDGDPGKLLVGISIFFAATLGISNAFILVPSQAIMQRASPEEGVARVYATYFTISNIFSFAPVLFAGAIADIVGVMRVMVAIAILLALTGVYNLRRAAPELPDDDMPLMTPS